jgi:hypothetical protein
LQNFETLPNSLKDENNQKKKKKLGLLKKHLIPGPDGLKKKLKNYPTLIPIQRLAYIGVC